MDASEARLLLENDSKRWYQHRDWSLESINGPVDENEDEYFFEALFRNTRSRDWSVTPFGVNKHTGEILNRTVDED